MGCKGKKGKRGKRFLALGAGLFLAGVLAAAGCTPEQNEGVGQKLNSAGQTVEKVRTITKYLPGAEGQAIDGILAGVSALLLAGGAYMTKRARDQKAKKEAYKEQLDQKGLDAANKKIYGEKFDPKLSK